MPYQVRKSCDYLPMRIIVMLAIAALACASQAQSLVTRDGNLLPLLLARSFCLESAVFVDGVRRPDLDEEAFSTLKIHFWAGVPGIVSNVLPGDCRDSDEGIPVVGAYVDLKHANGLLQALGRVDVYQLSRTGTGAQFAILWSQSAMSVFPQDLDKDIAIMVALLDPLTKLQDTSNRLLEGLP